ncbi:MAG: MgtC/SapB family protein [Clostridiales bacterium]|jgi:putative Mg2+ transporter-C (MgtC) family protein|nr:MgtC/SapB family protein [Clostridiales bacterium]
MFLELDSIIKILLAVFIGGVIGLEREAINRPAGLRTHILVCVASALIMDVNIKLIVGYVNADPVRMGAQVISGMGFLGAGTIIKEGVTVKGLTTAAGLWSVACLGLVIGAGYYMLALFAVVIMWITLKVFSRFETRINKSKRKRI